MRKPTGTESLAAAVGAAVIALPSYFGVLTPEWKQIVDARLDRFEAKLDAIRDRMPRQGGAPKPKSSAQVGGG